MKKPCPLLHLFLLSFFLALSPWKLAHASLGTPWSSLLDPRGSAGHFYGVQFDGLDPFELSAQSSLMPASTLKVLTSTVALERLGPDFRFETQVTWSVDPANPTVANDLTIYGSGDPTWGMAELGETPSTRMAELARVLTSSGIQEVSGPIQWKVSDERWNQLSTPPGWKANDLVSCYGALPTAFNLGLNCELFVVTGPNAGYWRDPRIQDPVEIKISKGTTDLVGLVRTESGFKVVGTLRSGTTAALPIPVIRVSAWLEKILLQEFKKSKLRVNQKAALSVSDPQLKSYTLTSVPLSKLLQPFMKQSLNLMGEVLLLKLGEKAATGKAVSLREAGLSVVQDLLVATSTAASVKVEDGCGLSRNDRVTPSAFFNLMTDVKNSQIFKPLFNALSIAGVDGTLRNRMKGTRAQGYFRGKTGTLNGVANLVGFIPDGPSDYLTVVVLGHNGPSELIKAGADRVVAKLSQLHRPTGWEQSGYSEEVLPPNPFETIGLSYDPRASEGNPDFHAESEENLLSPRTLVPDSLLDTPEFSRIR